MKTQYRKVENNNFPLDEDSYTNYDNRQMNNDYRNNFSNPNSPKAVSILSNQYSYEKNGMCQDSHYSNLNTLSVSCDYSPFDDYYEQQDSQEKLAKQYTRERIDSPTYYGRSLTSYLSDSVDLPICYDTMHSPRYNETSQNADNIFSPYETPDTYYHKNNRSLFHSASPVYMSPNSNQLNNSFDNFPRQFSPSTKSPVSRPLSGPVLRPLSGSLSRPLSGSLSGSMSRPLSGPVSRPVSKYSNPINESNIIDENYMNSPSSNPMSMNTFNSESFHSSPSFVHTTFHPPTVSIPEQQTMDYVTHSDNLLVPEELQTHTIAPVYRRAPCYSANAAMMKQHSNYMHQDTYQFSPVHSPRYSSSGHIQPLSYDDSQEMCHSCFSSPGLPSSPRVLHRINSNNHLSYTNVPVPSRFSVDSMTSIGSANLNQSRSMNNSLSPYVEKVQTNESLYNTNSKQVFSNVPNSTNQRSKRPNPSIQTRSTYSHPPIIITHEEPILSEYTEQIRKTLMIPQELIPLLPPLPVPIPDSMIVHNIQYNKNAKPDSKLCYEYLNTGQCKREKNHEVCVFQHIPATHLDALIDKIRSGRIPVKMIQEIDGQLIIRDLPSVYENNQYPGELNINAHAPASICYEFLNTHTCSRMNNGGICPYRHLVDIHPDAIAERFIHGLLSKEESTFWGLTLCGPLDTNPFATSESHVCFDYINSGTCKRNEQGQICRFKHLLPAHPMALQDKNKNLVNNTSTADEMVTQNVTEGNPSVSIHDPINEDSIQTNSIRNKNSSIFSDSYQSQSSDTSSILSTSLNSHSKNVSVQSVNVINSPTESVTNSLMITSGDSRHSRSSLKLHNRSKIYHTHNSDKSITSSMSSPIIIIEDELNENTADHSNEVLEEVSIQTRPVSLIHQTSDHNDDKSTLKQNNLSVTQNNSLEQTSTQQINTSLPMTTVSSQNTSSIPFMHNESKGNYNRVSKINQLSSHSKTSKDCKQNTITILDEK